MRAFLISALVLGSLAFSVGGVAVVVRADDADQTLVKPPAAQAAKPVQDCRPPQRLAVKAQTVPQDQDGVVVLNTKGYNYPRPGDVIHAAPAVRSNP